MALQSDKNEQLKSLIRRLMEGNNDFQEGMKSITNEVASSELKALQNEVRNALAVGNVKLTQTVRPRLPAVIKDSAAQLYLTNKFPNALPRIWNAYDTAGFVSRKPENISLNIIEIRDYHYIVFIKDVLQLSEVQLILKYGAFYRYCNPGKVILSLVLVHNVTEEVKAVGEKEDISIVKLP